MEIIKLKNRYGKAHQLIPIDEKHYQFKSAEDWMPVSIHIKKADECIAFDPEGGPFLSIGDTVEEKIIKAISAGDGGVIVEFE